MRLRCFYCGKVASNELPQDTIVRGVIQCPECVPNHTVTLCKPVTEGDDTLFWIKIEIGQGRYEGEVQKQ